ncbi:MAG: hypothetical protein Q7T87_19640 [Polaromonas sp.]|nr:hypothetical protein [Polaromonas sp.]
MGKRSYPDQPRVYIDMDGVLADFDAECVRRATTPDALKRCLGAYRALQPLPGAVDAIADLLALGVEVFVLTKIPSSNPWAATEKLLWIRDHFPSLDDRVIITPDKGCVGEARDVLVDDHPEWANADRFRGTKIHFGGDWAASMDAVLSALQCHSGNADAYVVARTRGR